MKTRLTPAEQAAAERFVAPRLSPGEADAVGQADAARREARAEGYAEGLALGRRAAEAEAADRLRRVAVAIEDLGTLRARVVREAELDLLELATRIAEAIVRERIPRDSEVVVRSLRAAVAEIPKGEPFTVRCHPGEEAVLAAWLSRPGTAPATWTLVPDGSISPGGCLVEGAAGEIDVRLETQLRLIEHELLSRS